jgi:hypothetical protein
MQMLSSSRSWCNLWEGSSVHHCFNTTLSTFLIIQRKHISRLRVVSLLRPYLRFWNKIYHGTVFPILHLSILPKITKDNDTNSITFILTWMFKEGRKAIQIFLIKAVMFIWLAILSYQVTPVIHYLPFTWPEFKSRVVKLSDISTSWRHTFIISFVEVLV